jgi:HEAT repeat protein
MTTPPLLRFFFGLALILGLGMATGCSKEGPTYNKSVDVAKQVELLKGGDAEKKAEALTALAEGGPYSVDAVPTLIETLNDPDPNVVSMAAYALGEIGPKASAAVPALKEAYDKSTRMEVTPAIVNALRAIDPSQAPDIGREQPGTAAGTPAPAAGGEQ